MDMLAVGVVTAAHGLKGELTVRSLSGRIDHLGALTAVRLRRGAEERGATVRSVRPKPPDVVVKIEGVDSPEQARTLRGFEIWVSRSEAAPLAGGEYYAADLCRCTLVCDGETVGRVRAVVDAGPTQLLEVQAAGGKLFLVPFAEHFIGDVDLEGGTIQLRDREIVS